METWLIVFVGVVSVAVLLQAALLAGIYMQLRRTTQRVEQVTRDIQQQALPLLAKAQALMEDVQPRVATILAESAEITRLARTQVQRVDRVLAEAADRLRLQLVHADQILTGALDSVEEASSQIRRGVNLASRPLQSIIALVRGVQSGIEFYRGIRRPTDGSAETPDETLFI